MIPVQFAEANTTLANDQEEYEPLAVYRYPKDPQGRFLMCFRLSDVELAEIARTRTLWVQQLTFNHPFQPIGLTIQKPDDLPKVTQ
jgi:hypothetical protein